MYTLNDIQNQIKYADISAYLATADINKSRAFSGGEYKGDKRIPFLLNVLSETLNYSQKFYLATGGIESVMNYTISICGSYLNKAKTTINNALGLLLYNTATNQPITLATINSQYIVGQSGSPAYGSTTQTIVDTNIIAGSVSVISDGIDLPISVSDRLSFAVAYSPSQIVITYNQPLNTDTTLQQVLKIRYDRFTAI